MRNIIISGFCNDYVLRSKDIACISCRIKYGNARLVKVESGREVMIELKKGEKIIIPTERFANGNDLFYEMQKIKQKIELCLS